MSKEQLVDIRGKVKEIMETPYVVRHKKAQEVGTNLIMTGKVDFLLQEIDTLNEQNKRYREVLEKLINAPGDMSRGRYADYADRIAREALEGDDAT